MAGPKALRVGGLSLADVDVITAYPIRPYDTVMQFVSQMISNGDFDCEYIVAESEHSQFEIVKHASAVGARVFAGYAGGGPGRGHQPLRRACVRGARAGPRNKRARGGGGDRGEGAGVDQNRRWAGRLAAGGQLAWSWTQL